MNSLKFITQKYNLDLGLSSPIEIPNMGRNNLAELFAELNYQVGAEIGTEAGLYAEVLCRANPQAKLYCVDAWTVYPNYREHVNQNKLDEIYAEAKTRLAPFNCELVKAFSAEVVANFGDQSLDFVYIDANHDYHFVSQDIARWSQKVRHGGIIAGHDYFIPGNNPLMKYGVVQAVNDYTAANKISPWFLIGTKAKIPGKIRDNRRSWMWIKTQQT